MSESIEPQPTESVEAPPTRRRSGGAGARVSISYRRDDCLPHANLLATTLRHRLDADVCLDIDSIPAGADYPAVHRERGRVVGRAHRDDRRRVDRRGRRGRSPAARQPEGLGASGDQVRARAEHHGDSGARRRSADAGSAQLPGASSPSSRTDTRSGSETAPGRTTVDGAGRRDHRHSGAAAGSARAGCRARRHPRRRRGRPRPARRLRDRRDSSCSPARSAHSGPASTACRREAKTMAGPGIWTANAVDVLPVRASTSPTITGARGATRSRTRQPGDRETRTRCTATADRPSMTVAPRGAQHAAVYIVVPMQTPAASPLWKHARRSATREPASESPLRPLADRCPAHRRSADGALQLALRAGLGRRRWCCGSRTPTASARRPRTSSRSSTRCAGSSSTGTRGR